MLLFLLVAVVVVVAVVLVEIWWVLQRWGCLGNAHAALKAWQQQKMQQKL
jgi:hypothetical protein